MAQSILAFEYHQRAAHYPTLAAGWGGLRHRPAVLRAQAPYTGLIPGTISTGPNDRTVCLRLDLKRGCRHLYSPSFRTRSPYERGLNSASVLT